jgi:hypothetical protein
MQTPSYYSRKTNFSIYSSCAAAKKGSYVKVSFLGASSSLLKPYY